MDHFVQYHKPEVMGRYNPDPSQTDFGIVTNKLPRLRLGDKVWLITRKGGPRRRYSLCETFVVARLESQPTGKFKFRASGSEGRSFRPPRKIGREPWLEELLTITGNFRYGLQLIKSRSVVKALERIATRSRGASR